MNKTIKKIADQKTQKKPKYELRMIRRLGKSQIGEIILAISNVNGLLVAIKTFKKEQLKIDFLID